MANGPPDFEEPDIEPTMESLARSMRYLSGYLGRYRTWAMGARKELANGVSRSDIGRTLEEKVTTLRTQMGFVMLVTAAVVVERIVKAVNG